jgi:hypothetical protein
MSRIKLVTPNGLRSTKSLLASCASIDAASRARGDLCESAADTHGTALMTNAIAAVQSQATVSGPDDAAGALCGSQREIVSYDNELTVKWRRAFNWKQRS